MDTKSPQQRHKNMAAIRSADTKPEMTVRRWLHSRGFRYRLNHPRLPGHPDIVLRKYRTCIFVNGCFWHGHEGCRYFRLPKTNVDFWRTKIERNRERDHRDYQALARLGWHTIVIWECSLRPAAVRSSRPSITSIWLTGRSGTGLRGLWSIRSAGRRTEAMGRWWRSRKLWRIFGNAF